MTDIGELLVLLHGARGRISTVRATVRTWRHLRRQSEALQRAGWTTYAPIASEREEFEEVVRVWFAPPGREREEREGSAGASVAISRGPHWWRYDEIRTPSARGYPSPMRLGAAGADELMLDVDAERGTLLRIESRFEREPIALSEVVEIAFDEAFDDDTFVFTPPPGERVRSVLELSPVRHELTIEQAVELAPFTVWIPARLPAGWQAEIGFAVEQDRPPMAPHVYLHYRAADGTHAMSIAEAPADRPGDDEAEGPGGPWEDTERNHRRMQRRAPAESWQPAQVRTELEGTRILVSSTDLGADALTDLAAGLIRADR